jgi:hypothetical protein
MPLALVAAMRPLRGLLLLANMVAAASAAASATDQSNVRQPWAFISRLTKYEGPQLTSGRDSAQHLFQCWQPSGRLPCPFIS